LKCDDSFLRSVVIPILSGKAVKSEIPLYIPRKPLGFREAAYMAEKNRLENRRSHGTYTKAERGDDRAVSADAVGPNSLLISSLQNKRSRLFQDSSRRNAQTQRNTSAWRGRLNKHAAKPTQRLRQQEGALEVDGIACGSSEKSQYSAMSLANESQKSCAWPWRYRCSSFRISDARKWSSNTSAIHREKSLL
jgi:hypothetical protein